MDHLSKPLENQQPNLSFYTYTPYPSTKPIIEGGWTNKKPHLLR